MQGKYLHSYFLFVVKMIGFGFGGSTAPAFGTTAGATTTTTTTGRLINSYCSVMLCFDN